MSIVANEYIEAVDIMNDHPYRIHIYVDNDAFGYIEGPTVYMKNSSVQRFKITCTEADHDTIAFKKWDISGAGATNSNPVTIEDTTKTSTFISIPSNCVGDISIRAVFYGVAVSVSGAPVFYSITGDLYSDPDLTNQVSTNFAYSSTTFYKNYGTSVTVSYLYNNGTCGTIGGDGLNPSQAYVDTKSNSNVSFLRSHISYLRTRFGSSGACMSNEWSSYRRESSDDGGTYYDTYYIYNVVKLSDGTKYTYDTGDQPSHSGSHDSTIYETLQEVVGTVYGCYHYDDVVL